MEVGVDEDGDPIKSCVLVEAEATGVSERRPVTGKAKIALDLLKKAIAAAGEDPPETPYIPRGVKVVPLSLWRRYCDQGNLVDGDKPDTFKKAYTRSKDRLRSDGNIGIWNERVWLIND